MEELMKVAEECVEACNAVDHSQIAFKSPVGKKSWSTESQGQDLNQRKMAVVDEKVRQLPERLGNQNAEAVRHYVMNYMRHKVSILLEQPRRFF